MQELTPELLDDLPKNGPTDPIEWYRWPLVGWLFRERINRGVRMLGARTFDRALEVGYGAGAVQLVLGGRTRELHGLDLDADPDSVKRLLARRGIAPTLVRGSVYDLPYETSSFDLVASFSVFEHLDAYEKGMREVARVLRPGGLFLLGMPQVNRMMEAGHRALGFKGIRDHHVTTPADVRPRFDATGFRLVDEAHLDVPAALPLGVRIYFNWLLERR